MSVDPPPADTDSRLPWGSRVREQPPLGQATFTKFVVGLAAQAQIHLGTVANPVTGQREPNLGFAQFTCDLLAMLQAKTSGNLDPAEAGLLATTLDELRAVLAAAQGPGNG